jgi:hypothetical protein
MVPCFAHARAAAAPMLRMVASLMSFTAPMPTSTRADFEPGAGAIGIVVQHLPSNPMAASCARVSPTSFGTGPSLATGMAMTGTVFETVNEVRMSPLYGGLPPAGSDGEAHRLLTGRDSPSCQRAIVHRRSDRRFRYGTT